MNILPNGDVPWSDLKEKEVVHLGPDSPAIEVAFIEGGMASGRPSVAIRLNLPDGRVVIAETSARLFASAGRALQAKFPNLFED